MLLNSLQHIKYDVIALQETKRNLEYHQKLNDGTEILLGPRDPARPVGGIGFVIAPHIVPYIESMTISSHRIGSLALKIGKRSRIQIVCAYAPTSDAGDETHEEFLEELRVAVRDHNVKFRVLIGDWNAKIGRKQDPTERMGSHGFGDRNEAGERLLEVIEELRLHHANSLFRKREDRKWTWRSPNNTVKNEIDHAFVSHRQMATDFDVVSPFCTGSDHRLVRLRLQLSDDLFYASSGTATRQNIELDPDVVRELTDRHLPAAATSYPGHRSNYRGYSKEGI
jgi:exonuclease III